MTQWKNRKTKRRGWCNNRNISLKSAIEALFSDQARQGPTSKYAASYPQIIVHYHICIFFFVSRTSSFSFCRCLSCGCPLLRKLVEFLSCRTLPGKINNYSLNMLIIQLLKILNLLLLIHFFAFSVFIFICFYEDQTNQRQFRGFCSILFNRYTHAAKENEIRQGPTVAG